MLIIGDHNWQDFAPDAQGRVNENNGGEVRMCALQPRETHPLYSAPLSSPNAVATKIPLIPMEEWPERIAELEAREATLWHAWKRSGIPVPDQNGLRYCHGFSPVFAIRLLTYLSGMPDEELSGSSVGAPVAGFRNQGAWIIDDLEQVVNVGVASTKFVPDLTTKEREFKQGWKEDAAKRRITEYEELQQRNFQEQGSALLSIIPTCDGYNWWEHAVTGLRIVDLKNGCRATDHNRYAKDIMNQWTAGWGEDGVGRLTGTKKIADEAYILRQRRAA